MMFPTEREDCPRARAVMVVTSSGRLVPKATRVRATTASGTPSKRARIQPLSTSRRAPAARPTAPRRNLPI